MNQVQYRAMQKSLISPILLHFDTNNIPSATDPTQDVPVSAIQFGLNDVPLNVNINKHLAFNNRPIEQMSSIDRRNFDAFDAVGELRALERSNASKNDINYKKSQKNEK